MGGSPLGGYVTTTCSEDDVCLSVIDFLTVSSSVSFLAAISHTGSHFLGVLVMSRLLLATPIRSPSDGSRFRAEIQGSSVYLDVSEASCWH